MDQKVLVTGGAGYLGSTLVPELLRNGYKVTVLDSLVFNQTSLLDCCADQNFNFIKKDICDMSLMKRMLPDFDIIIPLAAIVGAPACKFNPTLTRSVNYDAHNRMRRQDRKPQFVENGSIYMFKPSIISNHTNRIGGKMAMYEMKFWQTWELDTMQELDLLEYYYKKHLMKEN